MFFLEQPFFQLQYRYSKLGNYVQSFFKAGSESGSILRKVLDPDPQKMHAVPQPLFQVKEDANLQLINFEELR